MLQRQLDIVPAPEAQGQMTYLDVALFLHPQVDFPQLRDEIITVTNPDHSVSQLLLLTLQ